MSGKIARTPSTLVLLSVFTTLLGSHDLSASPRSDITITVFEDMGSYLYKEQVNCEDDTCIYSPPFETPPLWVIDNNEKALETIDDGYRLENTSLSIMYRALISVSEETDAKTRMSFPVSGVTGIDEKIDGVQVSTWIFPERIRTVILEGSNTEDSWQSFTNILILKSNNNVVSQVNMNLDRANGVLEANLSNNNPANALLAELNESTDVAPEISCSNVLELMSHAICENAEPQIIDELHFGQNSSSLSPKSREILDAFVEPLTNQIDFHFEIGAYTDSKGPKRWNLQLSADRAEVIRQYLIFKGVNANRLVSVGYGESSPIADNNTATGQRANRRVEIKRLGED